MHDLNYEHVTLYISRLRKWMVIKVIVGGYMGSSLSKSAKSTAKLGGVFCHEFVNSNIGIYVRRPLHNDQQDSLDY